MAVEPVFLQRRLLSAGRRDRLGPHRFTAGRREILRSDGGQRTTGPRVRTRAATQSKLVDDDTPLLVSEQQADCFTGVYLRWVAEGESPRFELNTTDGLDKVLAGALAIRDRPPDFNPFGLLPVEASHGTALDRVSAVQQGFDLGTASCARITMSDIRQRRGDIPAALFDPGRHPIRCGAHRGRRWHR